MTLKERLSDDLKAALRGGDERRKDTIRYAMAAIRNAEIAAGHELDDAGVEEVLRRQVKQRQDSIEEFRKGGRTDLVDKESAELAIVREYLPAQMTRQEIADAARQIMAETGATGMRDKGKVIGPLMKRLGKQADGRDV